MRFRSLTDEFEHILEAFGSGAVEAMRKEVAKLQAKIVEAEAQFIETGKAVDEASYTLGATDVAAELLAATAYRASNQAVLAELRAREPDLRALHQIALWTESCLAGDAPTEASQRSQSALAQALAISPSVISRSVLPRLQSAGLVRQSNRSSMRRAEITEAGLTALDQLRPGWRVCDPVTNEAADSMQDALDAAGTTLLEDDDQRAAAYVFGSLSTAPSVSEGRGVQDMRDVYHMVFNESRFLIGPNAPSAASEKPLAGHLRVLFGPDSRSDDMGFPHGPTDNDFMPTIVVHEPFDLPRPFRSAIDELLDRNHLNKISNKTAHSKHGLYRSPAFAWLQFGSKVKDDDEYTDAGHARSA